MTGMKRVWLACLLAIAGSGQLPLWLHHVVCHSHGDHAHCQHLTSAQDSNCTGTCGSAHCSGSSTASPAVAASCGQNHQHAGSHPAHSHVAHDQNACDVKKRVLRISSAADDHEDCAACFALSQPTLIASIQAGLQVTTFLPASPLAECGLPECDPLRAYSSRAPPAV